MKDNQLLSELECLRCFANMKPGEPDPINDCSTSLPYLAIRHLRDDVRRNLSVPPQLLLENMIVAAMAEARVKYSKKAKDCVNTYFNTKKYVKQLKDRMLRARFVAYTAYCVIASCQSDDMSRADKLLSMCGNFDYDQELTLADWIVPMSGNLDADIRANFVAKYIRKSGFDSAKEIFASALALTVEQIEENIKSRGRTNLIIPFFITRSLNLIRNIGVENIEEQGPASNDIDSNDLVLLFFKKSANPFNASPLKQTNDFIYQQLLTLQTEDPILWEAVYLSNLPFSGMSPTDMGASYVPNNAFVDNRALSNSKSVQGVSSVMTKKRYKSLDDDDCAGSPEWHVAFNEMISCADAGRLIDRERADILAAIKRRDAMKNKDQEIERLKKELQREREKNEILATKQSGKVKQLEEELSKQKDKYTAAVQHMDALEDKYSKLKKSAASAETNLANAKREADATYKEIQALQQQTASVYKETDEDESLDTSILNNLRIICEGGHKSWIAGMQDLHPNIHYYGADDTPPAEEVIRNADMVWIQPNSISHPRFWRASSIADQAGVPVRFFTFAGHKSCKKELVSEIQKYFEQGKGENT